MLILAEVSGHVKDQRKRIAIIFKILLYERVKKGVKMSKLPIFETLSVNTENIPKIGFWL